jgi:DNA-directed RNA polymerase subunit RPC12/RpoP
MPTATPKPTVFECPRCRDEIAVPAGSQGKRLQCPHCKHLVTVPGAFIVPGLAGSPDDNRAAAPMVVAPPLRVVLVDVDVPFGSILRELAKWTLASIIVAIPIAIVWVIVNAMVRK